MPKKHHPEEQVIGDGIVSGYRVLAWDFLRFKLIEIQSPPATGPSVAHSRIANRLLPFI